MRYSLRKLVTAALACMAVLGLSPAAASSIYTVDYTFPSRPDFVNVVTGTITTDGALGALVPQDMLSWNVTMTSTAPFVGVVVSIGSSDTGGTLTFMPPSFSATPTELDFDFGPRFTSSLFFDPVGFGFGPGCPIPGECGTIFGAGGTIFSRPLRSRFEGWPNCEGLE